MSLFQRVLFVTSRPGSLLETHRRESKNLPPSAAHFRENDFLKIIAARWPGNSLKPSRASARNSLRAERENSQASVSFPPSLRALAALRLCYVHSVSRAVPPQNWTEHSATPLRAIGVARQSDRAHVSPEFTRSLPHLGEMASHVIDAPTPLLCV